MNFILFKAAVARRPDGVEDVTSPNNEKFSFFFSEMRKIFGFSAQKILCCPTKKAKHHPMLAASGHHRFKAYSHCLQIHLQCKKKFVRNTECLLFKSRRKKRPKKRLIVNCFLLSITKCHFFVYLTKNKQLHYRIFSLI